MKYDFYHLNILRMSFLNIGFRKNLKKNISEKLFYLLRNTFDEKYSNELICFTIKAIHMNLPIYCMISMIWFPPFLAIPTYLGIIFAFTFFIYFQGCYISSLEYTLHKSDITIVDPVIMLFNDNINKNTRMIYSISVIIPYMFASTMIMLYRFGNYIPFVNNKIPPVV
ncbi:MAG: hypothetical protein CMF69_04730 [Magnetovibrio sp.]|nr:hypothetical protein [Magnetovibrio sp.]